VDTDISEANMFLRTRAQPPRIASGLPAVVKLVQGSKSGRTNRHGMHGVRKWKAAGKFKKHSYTPYTAEFL
jgi:hypothetical protein